MDKTVYGAFRSYPYSSYINLVSLHETFEGAKEALYPNKDYDFKPSSYLPDTWNGPDGFGVIKLLQIGK